MTTTVPSVRGRAGRALAGILLGATILGGGFYAAAQDPITPAAQTAAVTGTGLPGSFADLVSAVAPAVVSIRVTEAIPAAGDDLRERMPEFPPGSPFDRFFREFGDQFGQQGQPRQEMGEGSGFVIDPTGYIVTNNHVAGNASEITVVLNDGRELPATLIGADQATDLALIKVETDQPLPYLEFGESDTVRVGDWVVSVGNPFGLGGTVTAGIVSALGRNINAGPYDDFMQIDAPINRGNSGGPTFDVHGRVIGINTAIFSPSGGSVGIGFAVPASTAAPVLEELKAEGRVSRGWLGVRIQEVSPAIAESLDLEGARGALVAQVQPDSPAAAAGIEQGDVIISLDGQDIQHVRELSRLVAAHDDGQQVDVQVWRGGAPVDLDVTLGELPTDQQVASAGPEQSAPTHAGREVLGLELAALDGKSREQFGIPDGVEGVVVLGVSDEAGQTDVRPGDVIVKVGNEAVTRPAQLAQLVEDAKSNGRGSVLLLISRDGEERFVAMEIGNA